jgi:hypothetical protein
MRDFLVVTWYRFAALEFDRKIKVLALIGAIVGFLVGLFQYRKAQRWKKAEFLANEMKHFFATPRVQKALVLIDWGSRRFQLLESGAADVAETLVTRKMQASGLRPHVLLGPAASDDEVFVVDGAVALKGFTVEEAAIRDCYDAFLDGLEQFASYVKTGLVHVDSLRPYLGYWIAEIASPAQDSEDAAWCAALLTYISFYRFEGVLWLFEAFGHAISPSSPTYSSFLKGMGNPQAATELAQTIGYHYS